MGGIFGGGSSGSSSTVVNVPGPTAEETELTKQQIELQKQQIEILKQQRVEQGTAFEFLQKSLDELNKRQASLETDPVLKEITDLQLDVLRRGGRASPEERQLIKEATDAALAQGASDIETAQTAALKGVRDVLAPSRGLRPTDTPIQDQANQIGAEGVRQLGQLTRGLRGAQASAELDFPLARGQFLTEVSGFASNLAQASREFQAGLREQAFQNQLALAGMRQQGQLGLMGVQPSGAAALQALTNVRRSQTTTTSSFSQRGPSNVLGGLGMLAFGLGSLGSGIGGFTSLFGGGGAGAFAPWASSPLANIGLAGSASSRTLKTPEGAAVPAVILETVEKLPLEYWKYLNPADGLTGLHLGTYAEDFKRLTGLGDGKTLAYVDLFGLMLGAIQALSAQVKELKNAHAV